MKKIFIFFLVILIISSIIFFAIKDQLDVNKILNKIEKDTNFKVFLEKDEVWTFYPHFEYQNNISIKNSIYNFEMERGKLLISKDYWPNKPIKINLEAPNFNLEQIQFRESYLKAHYKNKQIFIDKFFSKIIEGNIEVKGKIETGNENIFNIYGKFKNIDLNLLLRQAKIANWDRVKVKISSPNFDINSNYKDTKNLISNLNGAMDLEGSLFFVSTEEERFGAALLSLLADKLNEMIAVSKSVNYLINKFADYPTTISGKLFFKDGIISSNKLLMENAEGKASVNAKLDIKTNEIDGAINFYENNQIILTAQLKGNLENPEILVGGEMFFTDEKNETKNIKKIFEEGIESLVNKLMETN